MGLTLHIAAIQEQEAEISDACIFSESALSQAIIDKLRQVQKVVEGQWLDEFPVVAVLAEKLPATCEVLYGEVKLIPKKDWEIVVDAASALLFNLNMFSLCKDDEAPFIGLAKSTALELELLSKEEMFVVAGIENHEKKAL